MPGPHQEAMPADPWPGEADTEAAKPRPEQLPQRCCQVSTILLLQAGRAPCPPLRAPLPAGRIIPGCAPCGGSIPRGKARSQPQAALPCFCRLLAEEQRGLAAPYPSLGSPSLPVPVGLSRRQHPVPRLLQAAFPCPWPCPAGSLPSELQPSLPHRGIYRKALPVPRTAQPNPDAAAAAPFEAASLL